MIIRDNDTKDIQYLKTKKETGQTFINLLNKKFKNQKIIDKKYKILRENDYLLFPLIENRAFSDKSHLAILILANICFLISSKVMELEINFIMFGCKYVLYSTISK